MPQSLIPPESIPPRARYEKLFENLTDVPSTRTGRGRPLVSREALLKGLIYRNLRGIHKLVKLEFELLNNLSIAEPLGFDPLRKPPSDERFSKFLRSDPNSYFQFIRKALFQEHIQEGVISAQRVGLDSCPIEVFVKENNLKTSNKDRLKNIAFFPETKTPPSEWVYISQTPLKNRSIIFEDIESMLSRTWNLNSLLL